MKLIIINGPNLNLLGSREQEIYGKRSFIDYLVELKKTFPELHIEYYQSNVEGEIINQLHAAQNNFNGIILNAAAYTHTSIAIADSIKAISIPVVEVHISNIFSRESYRRKSLIGEVCKGSISGFGLNSYKLAIQSFLI